MGGGFDLTLLDCDPAKEAGLVEGKAALSDAFTPTLEDLFLDLTTAADARGILPDTEEGDQ